jgi:cytoskeleton protein RodZ
MADLGELLRSAREAKGLTLDQIAQETRISARFLQAIEQEEFAKLPGGLFNRGFIRTYASKVGLDPDSAVRDYEELAGDTPKEVVAGGDAGPTDSSGSRIGPIALGGLIVMTILVWTMQRGEPPAEDRSARSEIGGEVAGSNDSSRTVPEQGLPMLAVADTSPPVPTASSTIAPDGPVSTPRPTEVEDPGLSIVTAASAQSAPTATLPGVSVQVEVHEATWVLVQADGRMLTDENGVILPPGSRQSYTAEDALDLTIGNAAGVTLNVNGREVTNLGRANQVRAFTITPDNAATLPGG